MNLRENVREGIKSIKANKLRTVLTAAIIAIGITSLVGILTAIDGIKASINSSFSELGASSFDIDEKDAGRGRNSGGVREKAYPKLKIEELSRFKSIYNFPARVTIMADVTGIAEAKRGSEKTNPNLRVVAGDENFMPNFGYNLSSGRTFSNIEIEGGSNVAIVGHEVSEKLFKDTDPINKGIIILGEKYIVIGVFEKSGSGFGGGGTDRMVAITLQNGKKYAAKKNMTYSARVTVFDPKEIDEAIGEATGILRIIRKDPLGTPNSFEIEKSESLAESLDKISGYLRIGAFSIGFITLIGASIGLINIMLVSVTERTQEIGVRKAMGATPHRIRQQFLIEAIIICLTGGIAGVIFGILIGNLVSILIDANQFIFPWLWIMIGLIICIIVGLISGSYPAIKASKLDPVESLRYE